MKTITNSPQLLNNIKVIIYLLILFLGLACMGLRLPIQNIPVLTGLGLLAGHVIHQSIFNRNIQPPFKIVGVVITILVVSQFLLWYYGTWNAVIFLSVLFSISFVIDMITEKKKNKKRPIPGNEVAVRSTHT